MNLPISYAFDAWHNKILYVISESSRRLSKVENDLKAIKHLKCWIDLSDLDAISLVDRKYISKIRDRSNNDCDFLQDKKLSMPILNPSISDLLMGRLGAIFDGEDDYMVVNNLANHYD